MTFVKTKAGKSEFIQSKVCYVTDVRELVELIITAKQLKNPLVKLGLDGGQGTFKVCLSVIDRGGIGLTNSVRDVFILFIGANVQETIEMFVTYGIY